MEPGAVLFVTLSLVLLYLLFTLIVGLRRNRNPRVDKASRRG